MICFDKIILTFVFIFSYSCFAQELELFELDDFVDPKEFRTNVQNDTIKSQSFLATYVLAGVDRNYQFRNEFSKSTISFIRITNSLYFSHFQMNLKLAKLNSHTCKNINCDGTPNFKSRLQFAIYSLDETTKEYLGRYQFSWNVVNRPGRGLIHEFSIDLDFSIPDENWPFYGGLIYANKPWEKEQYLGFAGRYTIIRFENNSNLKWGIGISGEDIGVWRWGVFRNEFSVELSGIPLSSSLHIIYSLSRQLYIGEWNHEVGAFLSIPLIGHLF